MGLWWVLQCSTVCLIPAVHVTLNSLCHVTGRREQGRVFSMSALRGCYDPDNIQPQVSLKASAQKEPQTREYRRRADAVAMKVCAGLSVVSLCFYNLEAAWKTKGNTKHPDLYYFT